MVIAVLDGEGEGRGRGAVASPSPGPGVKKSGLESVALGCRGRDARRVGLR